MKVVIQNVSTTDTWEKGRWVRSEREARNFCRSLRALDFVSNADLR